MQYRNNKLQVDMAILDFSVLHNKLLYKLKHMEYGNILKWVGNFQKRNVH